jgi:hypothetical protein
MIIYDFEKKKNQIQYPEKAIKKSTHTLFVCPEGTNGKNLIEKYSSIPPTNPINLSFLPSITGRDFFAGISISQNNL